MARPITQESRRRTIVDAAIRALMEAEGREVTITDVARRLDLTPNAIRYYYRDQDALLWAVRERAEQRFLTDRSSSIASVSDPRDQLVRAIGAGLPLGPDDAEWRVTFQPVVSVAPTFAHGEMIREVFDRQAAIYVGVLDVGVEAGVFRLAAPARDVARTLMVMEDYQGLRIVMRDPGFTRAEALRLMRQYAALATGVTLPEID